MSGYDPWSYAEKYKSEAANQRALFMWSNMAERFGIFAANDVASYTERGVAAKWLDQYKDPVPQLKWLHAIHNQGHGDKVHGANAKAEGVKAGVFDMFLPVPTCRQVQWQDGPVKSLWHGCYIELKVGNNDVSPIQNEFGLDMNRAGYATYVSWGWLEARQHILQYLGLTG